MLEDEPIAFVFKIVLLGDASVGKTSLINQYVEGRFATDYRPSIGVGFEFKDIFFEKVQAKVRVVIWDIAGQPKYDSQRNTYFSGCQGALIVYDITNASSFDNVRKKWVKDMKTYGKPDAAYILIGNKSDLVETRVISKEQGERLAGEVNVTSFIETSAKNGNNVEHAFLSLINKIYETTHKS